MTVTYERDNLLAMIKENFSFLKAEEIMIALYPTDDCDEKFLVGIEGIQRNRWKYIKFVSDCLDEPIIVQINKLNNDNFKKILSMISKDFSDRIITAINCDELYTDGKGCTVEINPKDKVNICIEDADIDGNTTIHVWHYGEKIEDNYVLDEIENVAKGDVFLLVMQIFKTYVKD